MLLLKPEGLYCPAGNFYVDPRRGVEHAIITHAHSDHARRGSRRYYCEESGEGLLRGRIGRGIAVKTLRYGEPIYFADVRVSLHSAGHILGSSQVRIEHGGQVWVVSGDYKREADPTCVPFETVPCDVFVTEATFGTPAFRWNKAADVGAQILRWWQSNATAGRNSLLFAYSLGKAQRVLGVLREHFLGERAIYCYPTLREMNDCYRAAGVPLANTICLGEIASTRRLRGELILAPQSILQSPLAHFLGDDFQTAFASGWMAHGERGYDTGFVMSDHADWDDLVRTILETGARRIYVQHRGSGALVRHLSHLWLAAFPEEALKEPVVEQLSFSV